MTQLSGVRDPWVLNRAHALGHAMQLTNILRDVGEDLQRGRIYVPDSVLRRHGLAVAEVERALHRNARLPEGWADAMEEVMKLADDHYTRAREGFAALPPFFRRPVADAAEAYRGIHAAIRRNGYDNLRRRARTSTATKICLSVRGIVGAARSRGSDADPLARLAS